MSTSDEHPDNSEMCDDPPASEPIPADLAALSEQMAGPQFSGNSAPVATDVACGKCGYNLYGVAINGVCPECGSLVAASVRGGALMYSDPAWVGRMASGIWTLQIVLAMGCLVIGVVASWRWPPGFAAAVAVVAGVLAAAIVYVTPEEPRELGRESGATRKGEIPRIMARASAVLALAGGGVAGLGVLRDFGFPAFGSAVTGIVMMCLSLGPVAEHLARVAKRTQAIEATTLLRAGFVCLLLSLGVIGLLMPLGGGAIGTALTLMGLAFVVIPLGVGMFALGLLRLGSAVGRARDLSQVYAKYMDARVT